MLSFHRSFGMSLDSWIYSDLRFDVVQMEKQVADMTKQRDLAQSRLEDFMKMVEHDESSKVS